MVVAGGQLLITILMVLIFWNVVVQHTYPISLKVYLSQFSRLFIVFFVPSLITYILHYSSFFESMYDLWNVTISVCIYVVSVICMSNTLLKDDLLYLKKMLKQFIYK